MEGYEAKAERNTHRACKKLVVHVHDEARIQAVIVFNTYVLRKKVTKSKAKDMMLNREQYL